MDEKEYLQTLGEQIVNPHARASILAEIQDHIEEQAQDYRASGMSEAVAMQEAVRQMGDPVSTGEALNQVHRPKFPIALFGLAVVLTVLGIAMQYLVYTHLTPDTAILSDTYLQRTILYNAIGLGLLLLCIFGNYMYLAKGAWILLAIFLLGLLPPWFFGSRFRGQVLGTFGRYGVLSFNGNKMITTSGGGALICPDADSAREILWYATQARESYPYYQHEAIGYNYRMSNICAGIGRGQMTIVDDHIAHHRHVQSLYEDLLADVEGITVHKAPSPEFDSNFWLCTATLDPALRIKGQENAYKQVITGAVGGAAGVTHSTSSAVTDCQPNDNVEALRMALDAANIESRPLWKPMHRQPVYRNNPAYTNGVSESLFKVGICLPSGPWVTDENVRYIVDNIKASIEK